MKRIHIDFQKLAMAFCLLTGLAVIFSCEEEEVGGQPVITNVRVLNPDLKDSTFTEAFPGTNIAIIGENLGGTKEIYFNEFFTPFNPNFVSEGNILLTIPDNAPTEAIDPDVPNTIRVVTNSGEVTYSFRLLQGAPQIASIDNEMALPGEMMVISGRNFLGTEMVTFPGGLEVNNFLVNEAGTQLRVQVPESLTEAGPLTITTPFGTSQSAMPINGVGNSGSILLNFDEVNTMVWGTDVLADVPEYPNARGSFAELRANGGGGWWDHGRSINASAVQWVPVENVNDPASRYAIKFEILSRLEWEGGTMFLSSTDDEWTYLARFEPWKVGEEATEPFVTDGWQTVTIPLTDFKTTPDEEGALEGTGESITSIKQLVGEDGQAGINIRVYSDGDNPAPTNILAGIDNIRVVKIQ